MHTGTHVIPSLPASALELCPLLLEDVAPLFTLAIVVLLLEGVMVVLEGVAVLQLVAAAVVVIQVIAVALLVLLVMLAAVGLASADSRLSDPLLHSQLLETVTTMYMDAQESQLNPYVRAYQCSLGRLPVMV